MKMFEILHMQYAKKLCKNVKLDTIDFLGVTVISKIGMMSLYYILSFKKSIILTRRNFHRHLVV